jgi:hypothetical protein
MRSREVGALFLVWLTACAGTPRAGTADIHPDERELTATRYELRDLTVGAMDDEPVRLGHQDYVVAMMELVACVRPSSDPMETARRLFELEQEVTFLAQVEEGEIVWTAPLERSLVKPTRDMAALTREYQGWCEEKHESGDCLSLLMDGPVLQDDDLYAVSMALALDTVAVLQETRDALKEMITPRALLASLVCAGTLYFMLWALPEPVSKSLAAVLTIALTAWLGVETVWSLMTAWVDMVGQVNRATHFAQLREASGKFSKVMSVNSARVLVMLLTAALGSATGHLAAKLPRLPGFSRATARAEAQGGLRLTEAAEVESVAASTEGSFAILLRSRRSTGSVSPTGPRRSALTIIRHQKGNRQVVINGQRWHLPKNKSVKDIPAKDPVGDQLQEAVTRAAREWHPGLMSQREAAAINRARAQGEHWKANLLEREARGRYVHRTVEREFKHLRWSPQGVDVFDPATGHRYELLTRTVSNMERHGRRMAAELFRMISF